MTFSFADRIDFYDNSVFEFGTKDKILSLLDIDNLKEGGHQFNANRAAKYAQLLLGLLIVLRDDYKKPLNLDRLLKYNSLIDLENLVWQSKEKYSADNKVLNALKPLENYLIGIPEYDASKIGGQSVQVLTQHSFIAAHLNVMLKSSVRNKSSINHLAI